MTRQVLVWWPGTNAYRAVSLHAGLSVDSSMDKRKLLRLVLPILAAVAAGVGWLMMEKPHRDVGGEVARHKMVPEELQMVLAEGGEAAAPYLDAVVELYGVVLDDDGRRVMLEGGVVASWDTTRAHRTLEEGELLKLKGRVTGYDDLFEEVRMDGLVLVE